MASPLAGDRFCRLMGLFRCSEKDIPPECSPLTSALVAARRGDEVLLVLSRKDHWWELPGGTIEKGETPRACAERELGEETGQDPWYMEMAGVFHLEFRDDGRTEYGAVFESKVGDLVPFVPNKEIARLKFWTPQEKLEGLNPIDREIALFVLKG